MYQLKEVAKNTLLVAAVVVGIVSAIGLVVVTTAVSFALAEILYNSIKEGAMTCL